METEEQKQERYKRLARQVTELNLEIDKLEKELNKDIHDTARPKDRKKLNARFKK